MTNEQLFFSLAGLLILALSAQSSVLRWQISKVEDGLGRRIDSVDAKIDALREVMNARFEAAHEALLRVKGVLDARLKHLEQDR